MDLSTQPLVLVSVLTVVGALLGGAVAHWKRGSAHHIATGALIGGLSLFLVSFVLTVYGSVIGAMAVVAVLALLAWQFVFG
jgi:hypothetical protein